MVDPDVKPFVCLVARRNSMKLMIGCVIPLQVSGLTSTLHKLEE